MQQDLRYNEKIDMIIPKTFCPKAMTSNGEDNEDSWIQECSCCETQSPGLVCISRVVSLTTMLR